MRFPKYVHPWGWVAGAAYLNEWLPGFFCIDGWRYGAVAGSIQVYEQIACQPEPHAGDQQPMQKNLPAVKGKGAMVKGKGAMAEAKAKLVEMRITIRWVKMAGRLFGRFTEPLHHPG